MFFFIFFFGNNEPFIAEFRVVNSVEKCCILYYLSVVCFRFQIPTIADL